MIQARLASAHCAGAGPDKLILEGFLKPALARHGLHSNIRHHWSVEAQISFLSHAKSGAASDSVFLQFRAAATQDNDAGCRYVLGTSCRPEGDSHVGADVLQHFALGLSCISTWTLWQKLVNIFTRHPLPYMYCEVHNRWCRFDPVDIDMSGFPCTDFSPMGKREGIQGKTFPVFLCLIAWRRCCKTPIVCLENVVQFPLEVLLAVVSDLYEVHVFEMDTWDSACEHVSRRRVFFLLLLRGIAGLCERLLTSQISLTCMFVK